MAVPPAREVAIDVIPADLGDEAAALRMRHRVRVKRIGRAWLRLDATPVNDGSGAADGDPSDEVLPVIGETASRIRVVTEEDGARVAMWIDRRDAWESVVAPVQLEVGGGGGAGAASGGAGAGVWLEAGAPVKVASGGGRGHPGRIIELRDDAVAVQGSVPAAFLGHVWIVPHDDHTKTDLAGTCPPRVWQPPPDPRPRMSLGEDAVIRAAAGEAAPALATLYESLDVVVLRRDVGWATVELRRPSARIRGYVPASALEPAEAPGELGASCGGRGFGMSHTDRIEVAAGTCLFDRANGEVVGVAIETQVRLGSRGRAGSEWPMVYVDNRWAISSLYVHDTGRDPTRPVLDSCARAPHRR
jgi:hypothetical protein